MQRRVGKQTPGQLAEFYVNDLSAFDVASEAPANVTAVVKGTDPFFSTIGVAGIQRRILYDGIDLPIWTYDAVARVTLYYEQDTLGNVRRLRGGRTLDPTKAAPASDLGGYRFSAFGRLKAADVGTPAPLLRGVEYDQPIRWQGRWFSEAAGGTYDFRARVWSPTLGEFLQADEFGFLTRTGTLWSWPGQNPFKWRDPRGRDAEEWFLRNGDMLAGGVALVAIAPIAIYTGSFVAAGEILTPSGATAMNWFIGTSMAWVGGKQVIDAAFKNDPMGVAMGIVTAASGFACVGDGLGAGPRAGGSPPGGLSPTNYPNPDPSMSEPPVRYEPQSIDEVVRMRRGLGPTTQATQGTANIEAHHRQQVPISQGGVMDELTQQTHRGAGAHTRHNLPSQLTPAQRALEIRNHWKQRGAEYILPGEGI